MEVKKYDKIVLDSTRSIDDIVADIKAELSKQESQNAGESYICYVSHAYSSGENAGVNYIVVSDDFKRLNRLSSNVIQANAYTKDEINELIAKVDAKIPVDEAKLAKQNELKRVEADILDKEQSIPRKRQELLTLSEEKRALEVNLATITELINEKQQAGENTDILEVQKRQYESDIATKSSQITNLESEINQLNSDIEVLNQTKERLKSEEALIQSPELATKVYVDEINANLTQNIDTKDAQNVKLTGDQTINDIKTFSVPPVSATNPTDTNQVANKAYVDNIANTKANDNVVVKLTGDQTINDIKTFSVPPVSATNPTANNQVANKAYVDSVVNTKANANATVNLTGNQTIAGNKTLSGATTFSGAITSTGANTFSGNNTFNTGQVTFNNKAPICNVAPAADTNLVNRAYSKKRGGYVAVTGGAINLNNGINFSLNLTSKVNITVTNAASNIGQTGEIFVAKGANISGFSAPFNFRVAQSGFGNNEVFSYTVVSRSLVRIVRS
ncbi:MULTISPECIES: hypothetical protein [Campylobacter]|uniref:Uncharacterized protein n=1 Tax=Campylobacter vicugnae TaxID=1660076 RepID=A0ABZ2E7A5_9BACT|nr:MULTISPECIES: hypothetical protein [unclassified Campylobacter]MCR8690608.1 hypothetical protein [Campylobacter sp. RM9264]MCR8701483.1 hypothetical protein [Campylobacter sp. RM12176]